MIKRIVKLTFQEQQEQVFLNELLPKQKNFTRGFEGCSHLEIWQDIHNSNIIFSYSYWNTEEDLNNYRYSEQFRAFWKKSKQLFSEPAYAVSVRLVEQIN